MTDPQQNIDIAQLTPAQRIVLAQDLWDSVLKVGAAPLTTPEQRTEIKRRIGLADSGDMLSEAWPAVRDTLLTGR